MDKIEAMKLLSEIKHYLTAGNPVWDVDEIAEACDMAIEALRNEINCVKCVHYTEKETYTGIKGVCKMDTAHREDLISRQAVIELTKNSYYNLAENMDDVWAMVADIEQIPSADEQDDNRLYIRIYANDEPSRKAEKLYQICGETESQEVAQWLKEYFPSADRPTGEWILQDTSYWRETHEGPVQVNRVNLKCSNCGWRNHGKKYYNYCPNCGARMGGDNK